MGFNFFCILYIIDDKNIDKGRKVYFLDDLKTNPALRDKLQMWFKRIMRTDH